MQKYRSLLQLLKCPSFPKQSPPKLLINCLPLRHKIWIKKQEPIEWVYGEQPDLVNVELVNAIQKLKINENPPFIILDIREQSERDIIDLPPKSKDGVKIPRINITLQDLQLGYYTADLPKNKYIIIMCNQGFQSGRAADFLRRNQFHPKILLGGIECLDGLIDLHMSDQGFN